VFYDRDHPRVYHPRVYFVIFYCSRVGSHHIAWERSGSTDEADLYFVPFYATKWQVWCNLLKRALFETPYLGDFKRFPPLFYGEWEEELEEVESAKRRAEEAKESKSSGKNGTDSAVSGRKVQTALPALGLRGLRELIRNALYRLSAHGHGSAVVVSNAKSGNDSDATEIRMIPSEKRQKFIDGLDRTNDYHYIGLHYLLSRLQISQTYYGKVAKQLAEVPSTSATMTSATTARSSSEFPYDDTWLNFHDEDSAMWRVGHDINKLTGKEFTSKEDENSLQISTDNPGNHDFFSDLGRKYFARKGGSDHIVWFGASEWDGFEEAYRYDTNPS
jgi:hypothetical protein